MKRNLMAIAAIAMLWTACSKDDAKDPPLPIDPEVTTPLLTMLYNSTDTTRWEYNADHTPKKSVYHYRDNTGPTLDEGGFTEAYKYENGKLTTVFGTPFGETKSEISFQIDYAGDKILKLSSLLYDKDQDSLGYHSSGKPEKIFHYRNSNGMRTLIYVDTLEWTGNNIGKKTRSYIHPNPDQVNYTQTYTYDDKANPSKMLQTAAFGSGVDVEELSNNNILTETRKEIVSGVTKVNTYTYTYKSDLVTKKIFDIKFGGHLPVKDTFYLEYSIQ